MGDQINLKWNDFEENVRLAFKDFRSVLNDVVLYCGNKKTYANRLVLCACSEVFKEMLLNSDLAKQQCPSVLLWETSMKELNLILDFMYFGEVKVTEAGLTSFLSLAERLQVKGLCGKDTGGSGSRPTPVHQNPRDKRAYPVLEEIATNHHDRPMEWNPHPQKKMRVDHSSAEHMKKPSKEHRRSYVANTETESNKSIKEEIDLDDMVSLEPEQVLVEGQEDFYISDSSPKNFPIQPLIETDMAMNDSLVGIDYPPISMDLNSSGMPFQCNFCMKTYKSQGSLQNHRSLYHRDLLRPKADADTSQQAQAL